MKNQQNTVMKTETRHTPRTDAVYEKWPRSADFEERESDLQALSESLEAENALFRAALEAQELASTFTKEGWHNLDPDDPRLTPYIGRWNGYQAPEVRFEEFMLKRDDLRKAALAQSGGKEVKP